MFRAIDDAPSLEIEDVILCCVIRAIAHLMGTVTDDCAAMVE
jgi:hypothetical protein